MISNATTYSRTRSAVDRINKQPRFMRPRAVKPSLRFSSVLHGSTSGLWMSSSGSTRSGDKSDPQSLGSGDRENFTKQNFNGAVEQKLPRFSPCRKVCSVGIQRRVSMESPKWSANDFFLESNSLLTSRGKERYPAISA